MPVTTEYNEDHTDKNENDVLPEISISFDENDSDLLQVSLNLNLYYNNNNEYLI